MAVVSMVNDAGEKGLLAFTGTARPLKEKLDVLELEGEFDVDTLGWSLVLYAGFLRRRLPFTRLERWQTDYLPVYAAWAAVVVVVFPPLAITEDELAFLMEGLNKAIRVVTNGP